MKGLTLDDNIPVLLKAPLSIEFLDESGDIIELSKLVGDNSINLRRLQSINDVEMINENLKKLIKYTGTFMLSFKYFWLVNQTDENYKTEQIKRYFSKLISYNNEELLAIFDLLGRDNYSPDFYCTEESVELLSSIISVSKEEITCFGYRLVRICFCRFSEIIFLSNNIEPLRCYVSSFYPPEEFFYSNPMVLVKVFDDNLELFSDLVRWHQYSLELFLTKVLKFNSLELLRKFLKVLVDKHRRAGKRLLSNNIHEGISSTVLSQILNHEYAKENCIEYFLNFFKDHTTHRSFEFRIFESSLIKSCADIAVQSLGTNSTFILSWISTNMSKELYNVCLCLVSYQSSLEEKEDKFINFYNELYKYQHSNFDIFYEMLLHAIEMHYPKAVDILVNTWCFGDHLNKHMKEILEKAREFGTVDILLKLARFFIHTGLCLNKEREFINALSFSWPYGLWINLKFEEIKLMISENFGMISPRSKEYIENVGNFMILLKDYFKNDLEIKNNISKMVDCSDDQMKMILDSLKNSKKDLYASKSIVGALALKVFMKNQVLAQYCFSLYKEMMFQK